MPRARRTAVGDGVEVGHGPSERPTPADQLCDHLLIALRWAKECGNGVAERAISVALLHIAQTADTHYDGDRPPS